MPAESTRSFISYAREDAEFALKLAADLRQAGVNVWVDRFDIPVGKNWPRAVEEALDSCGQFLLILSPVSVLSDNVMAELNSALDEKKPVLPVLYQACRLPFRVRASQYADFTADYRTGFSTLLKALAVVQAPEPAAPPLEITPATIKSVAVISEAIEQTTDPVPVPVSRHAEDAGDVHAIDGLQKGSRRFRRFLSNVLAPRRLEVQGWRRRLLLYGYGAVLVILIIGIGYIGHKVIFGTPFRGRAPAGREGLVPQVDTTKVNEKDGLTYVWIPPGTFQMGCSPGDSECDPDEKPAHQVTITKGLWMGRTEVTQEAYQRVMGTNPSKFKGAKLPAENITWDNARSYCQAVGMRLPTEAEWEYAARAGSKGSRYSDLDGIAWYSANGGSTTHDVAGKQANAWGLYDMLGNVWEWVADWYDQYPTGSATDPPGPGSGRFRSLRGGSWVNNARFARVSYRSWSVPASHYNNFGVRCGGN